MTIYVLIVWWMTGSVAIATHEFGSQAACQAAGQAFIQSTQGFVSGHQGFSCAAKNG